MTEPLFRDAPYTLSAAATVVAAEDGEIVLDRSLFYPAGGGQPGDRGMIELADGRILNVASTRYGDDRATIVLVIESLLDAGESLPVVDNEGAARDARKDEERAGWIVALPCPISA